MMEDLKTVKDHMDELHAIYMEHQEIVQNHDCGFISAMEVCNQIASLAAKGMDKINDIAEELSVSVDAVEYMYSLYKMMK